MHISPIVLAGLLGATSFTAAAEAAPVDFNTLARQCASRVHPETMAAIVDHESRFNPLAINLNYTASRLAHQPRTPSEATATAQWLLASGYNFDAGLGQVNSRNFGALGLSTVSVFDPCANLDGASRVLADCYARASAARMGAWALDGALSCYNSGSFTRGVTNGYVSAVRAMGPRPVALVTISSLRHGVRRIAARPHVEQRPKGPRLGPVQIGDGDVFAGGSGDVFGQTGVPGHISPQ